jgi:hypothetical protein
VADDVHSIDGEFKMSSKSSFTLAQPPLKADYLKFVISWICVGLNLISKGFFALFSTVKRLFADTSLPEEVFGREYNEADGFTDINYSLDIDDAIEAPADAVPPDKTSFYADHERRITAEHSPSILHSTLAWLNFFWEGFRSSNRDRRNHELARGLSPDQDVQVVEHLALTGASPTFCGQENVDIHADPVPPDKSPLFDPFSCRTKLFDVNLTCLSVQDGSTTRPAIQTTEQYQAGDDMTSRSGNSHLHVSQRKLCKPFIFFEPSTEYPSNHEPFKRAEQQPFSSCTFYVDDSQLSEQNSTFVHEVKQVCERLIPVKCPEPEDDPPSYQATVQLDANTETSDDVIPPDKISEY